MVDVAVDILILSNGPGEVTTWVLPVVRSLRRELGDDRSRVRISVVLSPCVNASGKEAEIVSSYSEVDRVQAPEHFWQFLVWGKTAQNWDWRDRGCVLFLGGDQFFPLVIGKRLRYRTAIYAEWEARWHRWIDRFAVMKPEIIARVSPKYVEKFTVVGDLMAEAGRELGEIFLELGELGEKELIGLLPGSKAAKLAQGVPLLLAIAEHIQAARPQTRFVIPVAPTLDLATLVRFANRQQNPVIELVAGTDAELVIPDREDDSLKPQLPFLKTSTGLCVELWTQFPAYDLLSQCSLCLTTVGANTAELGALAIPMIVLLPTNQLDAMRAWDGLPGLLANLPGVGTPLAKLINWLALRRLGFLAWPNIWAQSTVVPELVGLLQPPGVAQLALDFLNHPEKLEQMRARLRAIRGKPGAAQKLAAVVGELVRTQSFD